MPASCNICFEMKNPTQKKPETPDSNKFSFTLEKQNLENALYLVSTPIGHLKDITLHALEILISADYIFCEDTRVTSKLLQAYGIKRKLSVYNDHASNEQRDEIVKLALDEKSVALVSDAGAPLISDPGYKLVRNICRKGGKVITVPGASSVISALQLSGLPSDSFSFFGFIPSKSKAREEFLLTKKLNKETLVFFETVPRIVKTLDAIDSIFGDRNCAVARELTKKFETIYRGTAKDILLQMEKDTVKGELVLLIEGCTLNLDNSQNLENLLNSYMAEMSLRNAVEEVSKILSLPKKQVYTKALELKE
ncbi:MAG: 16S rRNA (cytidine(1402)-2'-O)-methyltransferase [Alphaproteobacteria bacterium]|nr:16S rRNA (cytidine(1402)-2'-O)-methyltransferase [Alphaproteobacteria bacterium]